MDASLTLQLLQDGFFAAVAAVGFAAISRPPRQAYIWCALIAAAGHSTRFLLQHQEIFPGLSGIVAATTLASLVVGILAVLCSPIARMPAETCLYPALLPMIPGMYAYRCFGALAVCVLHPAQATYDKYFYLFASNGMVCLFTLLGMVLAASVPIFLFKKISFTATR
ncbi:MAG: threonine/serine exporter family protein [Muribaculaceae bacterium]|nr:threonine/serine exporter family protein [Muribaculaceae bacterium]